jgi:hypothetical protein
MGLLLFGVGILKKYDPPKYGGVYPELEEMTIARAFFAL